MTRGTASDCKFGYSGFSLSEFHSAGHTTSKITVLDIGELEVPEQRVKAVRDTLSSPRLDNVVSAAFMSREAKQ